MKTLERFWEWPRVTTENLIGLALLAAAWLTLGFVNWRIRRGK